MLNRVRLPAGNRFKYSALDRELFYDTLEESLYMRYDNEWILIGGKWKQNPLVAGTNLQILYEDVDTKHWLPATIRLIDDIDIDSMTLGKFSTVTRWKGTKLLGRIENTTFFPLCKFSTDAGKMIAGQVLLKIRRGNFTDYEMYHISVNSNGKSASIFGSSAINVKCTVDQIVMNNGEAYIGLRTNPTLREVETMERIYDPPRSIEVWFNGWDTRTEDLIPSYEGISDSNFSSSKVLARN